MSSKFRTVALLAALVPLCAAAAAPKPANRAAPFVVVERQVDAAVATHAVPSLAIAAVERGRVIWMHVRGSADIAARRKATPDTVYRIGSASKSFTATVAAVAKADGRVDLAQPLSAYLPAYAPGTRLGSARLQDLLDMSAGLVQAVHYRGLPGDFADLDGERFVADYAIAPLPSRSRYADSNMGPELAARAIGAAVHEPFAQYAHDRLFAPLHMTHTQCTVHALSPASTATAYGPALAPIAATYDIDPAAGAGCLSSLRDLAAYANFHLSTKQLNRRLPGTVALARLHTPRAGGHYANGWRQFGSGELEQLISDGQVKGGAAVILLAPGQRAGVIVLANTATDIVYQLAHAALEVLVPGTRAEFERAAAVLQVDHDRQVAADYPPAPPWSARGSVSVAGSTKPITVATAADAIAVRYDGGAPDEGKPLERDDGFARWQISCADFLPACRQGQDAEARLVLVRDGDGYAGAIYVDSRLGLFPYEVHLAPEP